MVANTLDGDNHDDNKRLEKDENGSGNSDEARETTQSFTDSLHFQDAIHSAIKLRKAGNGAFRAGKYELSTNIYEDDAYKIVYLHGLQLIVSIPSDHLSFTNQSLRCTSNSIQTKQPVGSELKATYPRRAKFHAF